jgi:hypothetical protein
VTVTKTKSGSNFVYAASPTDGRIPSWSGCDSVSSDRKTCTVNSTGNKTISVEYLVPVYRRYNPKDPDFLYSLDANEAKATYPTGGLVSFYLYQTNKTGRIPINRCIVTNPTVTHFLSTQNDCEASLAVSSTKEDKGLLGYLAPAPVTTGEPLLYRYQVKSNEALFVSTPNSLLTPNNYLQERSLGYLPYRPPATWIPTNGVVCTTVCSKKGIVSVSKSYGKSCASGENRPTTDQIISYPYGTWDNGKPFSNSNSESGYCYSDGQKHDHDNTDITVACYCQNP